MHRYKAYFRWSHYQFKLQPGLVLPEETEACASVTSAFLQVNLPSSAHDVAVKHGVQPDAA